MFAKSKASKKKTNNRFVYSICAFVTIFLTVCIHITASGSYSSADSFNTAHEAHKLNTSTSAYVIDNIHTDALAPYIFDGELKLGATYDSYETGSLQKIQADPEQLIFQINNAAQTRVPAQAEYAFLGAAGSTVWIAPQTRNSKIIWPGFSTENATLQENGVTQIEFELLTAHGPGKAELYVQDFGAPKRIFSSTENLGRWVLNVPQHAHLNWAFTEPGEYQLQFRALADIKGESQEATAVYAFRVIGGSAHPDTNSDATETPAETPAAENSAPQPHAPSQQPQEETFCAPALTLEHGHIDLFRVAAAGTTASLSLLEDVTGSGVIHQPETTVVKISNSAKHGNEYVLPLTQQANLPWPGWSTTATAASGYTDVQIAVLGVTGPGEVHLATADAFGRTKTLLSHEGTKLPGIIHEPQPAHTHAQWRFSAAGVYQLAVKAILRHPQTGHKIETATHTYTFQVGDVALATALCNLQAVANSQTETAQNQAVEPQPAAANTQVADTAAQNQPAQPSGTQTVVKQPEFSKLLLAGALSGGTAFSVVTLLGAGIMRYLKTR